MGKKEEKKRSIHGDNTNILAKEFKTFAVKKFGKQISLLIIIVNKLKSKSTIFNKLPNEVMSSLYIVWECWTEFLEMLMALVLSQ